MADRKTKFLVEPTAKIGEVNGAFDGENTSEEPGHSASASHGAQDAESADGINHIHWSNTTESYISVPGDVIDYHDILDEAFEGFEYDTIQNEIFNAHLELKGRMAYIVAFLRYLILLLVGIFTGLSAALIDIAIEKLSHVKFQVVADLAEKYRDVPSILAPITVWCSINAALVLVCSILVVFIAPVAAGSGIPQIKCYLNGINIPCVMRFVTMLVKGIGVFLAVCGGLAVGKEGPMIHVGAVIAAGLSQGRITFLKKSLAIFRVFRSDREKRDFVSAGAAAGVAAAFGAPVGGLLFALEEGSSFLSPIIMWRILFSSMTSMFTLAFFKNILREEKFVFTPGGLISFGSFEFLRSYDLVEIACFIVMGLIGGLSGALFIRLNTALTSFRKKHVTSRLGKIFEAATIACLTAAVGWGLMWSINDCSPISNTEAAFPLRLMCADNEFNSISSLFFATPEKSVVTLLHDSYLTYRPLTLAVYVPIYFVIACMTYGLSVPSGLFIPGLLVGAAWGRICGFLLFWLNPRLFPEPRKFALIGAAAQLGGIVRMVVSLTVILMEATGSVIFGLPILLTLVVAKYTGDYFNEGIYDTHIGLSGMALLEWEPNILAVTKRAYDVMSSPVVFLRPVMNVGDLIRCIERHMHHAFPIVEGEVEPERFCYGTLIGMISSEHLALLLKKEVFRSADDNDLRPKLTIYDYDDAYPRFYKLTEVLKDLTADDMECSIDLRPYMNEAPYRVTENMTMTRIFFLFRSLGLRHLPVVDNNNQVRGIITRKDLRRFRFEAKGPLVHVDEMVFSRRMDA